MVQAMELATTLPMAPHHAPLPGCPASFLKARSRGAGIEPPAGDAGEAGTHVCSPASWHQPGGFCRRPQIHSSVYLYLLEAMALSEMAAGISRFKNLRTEQTQPRPT